MGDRRSDHGRKPRYRRFFARLRSRWVLSMLLGLAAAGAQVAGIASGWNEVPVEARSAMIVLAAVLTAMMSMLPGLINSVPNGTRAEAPTGPVPRQLPPVTRHFTGREQTITDMRAYLEHTRKLGTSVPMIVINGKGGVGKTALAIRFAHLIAADYPDGRLYVNLRGQEEGKRDDPVAVLGRFLGALGVDVNAIAVEDLDDLSDLYQERLAGRRVLVVLDNAWNEAQVRPLLPRNPGCAVVITSRRPLAGLVDAHRVPLDVIPPDDAVELLGKVAGAERVAREPDAAQEIARLCGYLPLALRIAGARLQTRPHWTLAHLVDRLRDERSVLRELEVGEQAVRASVHMSYEGLGRREQRAFRLLGLVQAGSFGAWVLAALVDSDLAEAELLIEELVDAQLVEAYGTDATGMTRYRLHDLIRAYAQELVQQASNRERNNAVKRLAGAYLTMAEHAQRAIEPEYVEPGTAQRWRPGDQSLAALVQRQPRAWYIAECPGLARVIEQAHEHGLWELCWEIGSLLCTNFESLRGYWAAWQRTFDLALNAARRVNNRYGQAVLLHARGAWFRDQDRFAEAGGQFRQALGLYRELGDRKGEAETLTSIGDSLRARGWYVEGEEIIRQALGLFRELGDRAGEGRALRHLGGIHRSLHRLKEAEADLRQALDIARELGDRSEEARTLRSLGGVCILQHRFADADEMLEQAVWLLEELGDKSWRARTLYTLARLRLEQGQLAEADELLREALATFEEFHNRQWAARVQRVLADLRRRQGRLDEARLLIEEALDTFKALELRLWYAHGLRALARVDRERREYASAAEHLRMAIHEFEQHGDDWTKADAQRLLGGILRAQKRYAEARELLDAALATFREFEDGWRELKTLRERAMVRRAMGDRAGAKEDRRRARELAAALA
ncbi:hypothetical protein LI90_3993 [Carbonactinospora thermoautotrophica]|uniref:NB-ARC domain-containing protein n=1 Tax=Carbonactinospora thermoautotrophica TaxID=1469144 RepID=A0A132MYN5_9ACTN|nr:tetratricopeptide repeat protein [Carbonactinospora thermoautotrophica]KWX02944.1 hypothetical protein LI90_3993 [Carbonactinospora thermoautotrophica]